MPEKYLIAVDIGTQGTKTALITLEGRIISTLAKSRREAALARMDRQEVTSGKKESLPLPWHEKLLQHRYAGTAVMFIAVIWAAIIGFLVWLTGFWRPLSQSDLATFFDPDTGARMQSLDEWPGSQ
jgi:hypothetical protein